MNAYALIRRHQPIFARAAAKTARYELDKRQGGKIGLSCVADKFAVFQRATGKWQKVKPKFLALSLSDM